MFLSDSVDEEQTTKTGCKSVSMKEGKTQIIMTAPYKILLNLQFQIKHLQGRLVALQ